MQKLSKRERNLVIICVLFLIVTLVVVLMPSSKSAGSKKLLSKEQADRQYRVAESTYKHLNQEQDDLTPKLSKMAYVETPQALVPRVVRDLQQVATRSGVHLREVRPLRASPLPSGQGSRVPLEVRISAPFQPDIVRFLYNLEDPTGKMVVDKMDVTTAEDHRSKAVEISAVITVFTRSTAGNTDTEEGGDTSDGTDTSGQS